MRSHLLPNHPKATLVYSSYHRVIGDKLLSYSHEEDSFRRPVPSGTAKWICLTKRFVEELHHIPNHSNQTEIANLKLYILNNELIKTEERRWLRDNYPL